MKLSGEKNGYYLIEWQSRTAFLNDLLYSFPQLAIGKFLLSTSFDSGPLHLSEGEIEQGWRSIRGFALSPKIEGLEQIPFCHYSEWYAFEKSIIVGEYESFINFGGFSLFDEFFADSADRFWSQILTMDAESYFAEGDNLICVTRNRVVFEQMCG